jgi:hypothetical protein
VGLLRKQFSSPYGEVYAGECARRVGCRVGGFGCCWEVALRLVLELVGRWLLLLGCVNDVAG